MMNPSYELMEAVDFFHRYCGRIAKDLGSRFFGAMV
jgi:hypothetical protein